MRLQFKLLENQKRFLKKAKEVEDPTAEPAYFHAALMLCILRP